MQQLNSLKLVVGCGQVVKHVFTRKEAIRKQTKTLLLKNEDFTQKCTINLCGIFCILHVKIIKKLTRLSEACICNHCSYNEDSSIQNFTDSCPGCMSTIVLCCFR